MDNSFKEIADQLDRCSSFAQMKRFMVNESELERLGSGSAREVFVFDDRHVLKVAKNTKGLAQNVIESDLGINDWYGQYIARTIDADYENNRYNLAEKACDSIKSKSGLGKAIKATYGIEHNDFLVFMQEMGSEILTSRSDRNKISEIMEKYEDETEFFTDMQDLIINFGMLTGDMDRHSTWGFVEDRLVMKDYGLTLDVYKDFYEKKPSPSFRF